MDHLRLKTIRFSARLVLVTPTGALTLNAVGEGRRAPHESKISETLGFRKASGKATSETYKERDVGDIIYTYKPASTRGDGGRPWVRDAREPSQGQSPDKSFKSLVNQISTAQSIVEAGPATVNGQPVRQFTLTFAPGVYPQSELPFGEVLEKSCPQPVQLNLSIDTAGLPVLLSLTETYLQSKEMFTSTSTTEILATNFPLARIKPPPAKQTISAAALREFESKRQSAKLRKLEKQQAHRHHKKH